MPVTFGSVGDIIAVCLLVKDLVDALDKSRGSKAEYRSLISELRTLERVLLHIDTFSRNNGANPGLRGILQTIGEAVAHCQGLVSEFLQRVKKYQYVFDESGTSSAKRSYVKDAAMSVRWSIGESDAVDKFRVDLAGASSNLHMLLGTASM